MLKSCLSSLDARSSSAKSVGVCWKCVLACGFALVSVSSTVMLSYDWILEGSVGCVMVWTESIVGVDERADDELCSVASRHALSVVVSTTVVPVSCPLCWSWSRCAVRASMRSLVTTSGNQRSFLSFSVKLFNWPIILPPCWSA